MAFEPSELISLLGRRYLGCYSRLDAMCHDGKYPVISQAERLLAESYGTEASSAASMAPVLCAGAVWNIFKRSYAFNDTLAGFLISAAESLELSAELPLEGLRHLPLPCVHIQAPDAIGKGIDGFFAWVEDSDDIVPVLRLVFAFDNMEFFLSSHICLMPEASVGDCLPDAMTVTAPVIWAAAQGNDRAWALLSGVPAVPGKLGNVIHNLTARAVQLLLYLVSVDADVPEAAVPDGRTAQTVSVGTQAGARLREVASQKRSHIRQGHWHKYWVGPKTGERRLVAKWIEPVIVGDGRIKASKVTLKGIE